MKLHITKRHNELVETEYELPVYLYFQDEFSNDTLVKVFEGNNGKLSAITVCHENFSFSIKQEAIYVVEDIRLESCITTEAHFNEMYEEALMMLNITVYGKVEKEKQADFSFDKIWEKYRATTNNEDAWSFKEWMKNEFSTKIVIK